jgi:hypothetical protein
MYDWYMMLVLRLCVGFGYIGPQSVLLERITDETLKELEENI